MWEMEGITSEDVSAAGIPTGKDDLSPTDHLAHQSNSRTDNDLPGPPHKGPGTSSVTQHSFFSLPSFFVLHHTQVMRKTSATSLPNVIDPSWHIGIVASSYYKEEIDALVAGAKEILSEAGIPESNIRLYSAPGSFELPLIGSAAAAADEVDALIAFGIIVEGETHHARLLAEQTARGIMDVQLTFGIPFAFEVLYVNDLAQARERTKGEGNKGREAALAVLHSLAQLAEIHARSIE
jgi:6,7-dimethyl-8-ribityllumazine synthase